MDNERLKIYIASPYSNMNKEEAVQFQFDVAHEILKLGHNPYVPLYNHYIQEKYPDNLNENFPWIDLDKDWLECCDIVLRFNLKDTNGNLIPSPGADAEVKHAKDLHILVYEFHDFDDFMKKEEFFTHLESYTLLIRQINLIKGQNA